MHWMHLGFLWMICKLHAATGNKRQNDEQDEKLASTKKGTHKKITVTKAAKVALPTAESMNIIATDFVKMEVHTKKGCRG